MKHHNVHRKISEQGFALLITLVVVGVVLSVGLSILDLSIKQVRLSSNAKDSEVSFHAANAGMECARYVRQVNASDMEVGSGITPACFSGTVSNNTDGSVPSIDPNPGMYIDSGTGEAFIYEYDISWGTPADRCTKVTTLVASTSITSVGNLVIEDVSEDMPGYPLATKECEPGARCTVISVKGYNKNCAAVNAGSTYGIVEREVLLQF